MAAYYIALNSTEHVQRSSKKKYRQIKSKQKQYDEILKVKIVKEMEGNKNNKI